MKARLLVGIFIAAIPPLALALVASVASDASGDNRRPTPQVVQTDAPTVSATLASALEQFRWGQTHAEVARVMNQTAGVFDVDYNSQLARMQPGVAMQAVEAERDQKKKSFEASWVQFLDTPTGFDNTHIKGEYSYRNHESVMYVDRGGKRRYFFFIGTPPGERLWKIYDDIPLKVGGLLGQNFQEAVTKLNVKYATPARIRAADASKGLAHTTADWQDGSTHLRAEDLGDGNAAVVIEEKNTLNNLPQLRANKEVDPLAMDPSIAAITRGGISDPNAFRVQADAGRGATHH